MDLISSVYDRLKTEIIHWRYQPGQRLPAEVLATEMGVSRTPVREALRRLEQENLVTYTPRLGYSVRTIELKDFNELYQVRLILESAAAKQAAEMASSPEGKTLVDDLMATWQGRGEDPPNGERTDLVYDDEAFHESIALVAGNRYLHDLLRSINERIRIVRIVDFHHPERLKTTYREHIEIIKAIVRGDGEGAAKAMETHIGGSKEHIKDNLMQALLKAYGGPGESM